MFSQSGAKESNQDKISYQIKVPPRPSYVNLSCFINHEILNLERGQYLIIDVEYYNWYKFDNEGWGVSIFLSKQWKRTATAKSPFSRNAFSVSKIESCASINHFAMAAKTLAFWTYYC